MARLRHVDAKRWLPGWVVRARDALAQPIWLRRVHGWATVFWVAMAPPSMLWWKNSVPYLVGLSVYAAVTGHLAAWQGARTEDLQEQTKLGSGSAPLDAVGDDGAMTLEGSPTPAEVRDRFTSRELSEDLLIRTDQVRAAFQELAMLVFDTTPHSRERVKALDDLELACSWTVRAVSRHGTRAPT